MRTKILFGRYFPHYLEYCFHVLFYYYYFFTINTNSTTATGKHSHQQAQLATIHSNTTTGNHILTHCKTHHKPTKLNHNFNKNPPLATTDQQISTARESNWSLSEPRRARERSASNRQSPAPPRSLLRERSEAHVTTANPTKIGTMSYADEREGKHSES